MRLRLSVLLSVMCVVAAPVRGHAGPDDGEPSSEDKAEARRLTEEGIAAQDDGDYTAAIERFEAAYRRVPHPVLLFNLGQAHRLAGNLAQALRYYQRYLEVDPDGEKADLAREHAAAIRAENAEINVAMAPAEPLAGDEPVVARSHPGRSLRWAGTTTLVVGVAAIGVGIWYGYRAQSISDDLSGYDGEAWRDYVLAQQAEGKRAEASMIVFTTAGTAALVTGGLLWWAGHRRDERATTATVSLVPGGAGVTVSGHW